MSKRAMRLHLFCSVKGGVGKSTLATAAAKVLALQGRKPAFFDCDLSGTSIGDGLRLCAPDVELIEGMVDVLAEPTGRYLTVAQTEERRRIRRVRKLEDGLTKDHPYSLPYLNDALNYAFAVRRRADLPIKGPRTDALLWRHEKDDDVLYFPSSSVLQDVQASMVWFPDEPFDFAYAFMRTVDSLLERRHEITDIIVDLPPGLYGFPHEVLEIAKNLHLGAVFDKDFPQWVGGSTEWRVNPIMVTSQDPNDYTPALEFIGMQGDELDLYAVVNKTAMVGLEQVKAEARRRLGPMLANAGFEAMKLKGLDYNAALAKLFRDGDIDGQDIPTGLSEVLGLVNL